MCVAKNGVIEILSSQSQSFSSVNFSKLVCENEKKGIKINKLISFFISFNKINNSPNYDINI